MSRRPRVKAGYVTLAKDGKHVIIRLSYGCNSFGEPDTFAGKRPAGGLKEFAELRGMPVDMIHRWAARYGYRFESSV